MPRIPVAAAKPRHWPAYLLTSVGKASDFYTLGTIPELDEENKLSDAFYPSTTYVLRFYGNTMDVVAQVPNRLDELVVVKDRSGSSAMLAAGFAPAVYAVAATGCVEQPIARVPGSFKSLWGSEEHLFACGGFAPFVLYRQHGIWMELPLPEGCPHLWGISGQHERDVYFVGDGGWALHFDGAQLVKLELPTTNNLTKVARLDRDYLCISGHGGMLLMGNRQGFRIVPTHTREEPLHAIVAFQGAVYYPSLEGVWRFDGKAAPTLEHPQACRWISALDDALLISAAESAWLFDGSGVQELDTYV